MLVTAETKQTIAEILLFFQFQRSLMSFVSRNLCREMQSHVKGVYVYSLLVFQLMHRARKYDERC